MLINFYAFKFHIGQHFNQWAFYFIKYFFYFQLYDLWRKFFFQLKRNVCIFTSIFFYFFNFHITHVALILSFFTNQCFNVNGFVTKVFFAQQIHASFSFGLNYIMRQHRIKKRTFYVDVVPFQHQQIIFDVLSNPFLFWVFKNGFEFIK